MSIVPLVSGGLDSSLLVSLILDEAIPQHPLFVDYGQRFAEQEWSACTAVLSRIGAPPPIRMELSGFGRVVPSGLTNQSLDVFEDAFLPGRNLLLLLAAASYAYSQQSNAVAIGLLSEESHLFPDQTADFLASATHAFDVAFGHHITLVAPLMSLTKGEVISLATERGIHDTYSCHTGSSSPCGRCVSCREIAAARSVLHLGGD